MHGQQTQKNPREPYYYSGQAVVAGGGTGQIIFSVSSAWNFWGTHFSWRVDINSANLIPYFSFGIKNNDESLQNNWIPADVTNGIMYELSTNPDTRYLPKDTTWEKLPVPRLFKASSTIVVDLRSDLVAGAANETITFVMKGFYIKR